MIVPRWSCTVTWQLAHKVAEGGGCWAHRQRCGTWEPVDLAKLLIKTNPLYSLWNRSPACPNGCGSKLSFHAQHTPNARVILLQTPKPDDIQVKDLLARGGTMSGPVDWIFGRIGTPQT